MYAYAYLDLGIDIDTYANGDVDPQLPALPNFSSRCSAAQECERVGLSSLVGTVSGSPDIIHVYVPILRTWRGYDEVLAAAF